MLLFLQWISLESPAIIYIMVYWPSIRSWILAILELVVYIDRYRVEVHKLAKKQPRPVSSHLKQTSLVNEVFITWKQNFIFLRVTVGNPERARLRHVAHSSRQSQCSICFILPAHRGNCIVMFVIAFLVPVIHDDEPRKKSAARRATWDGSRDSSTVAQLLSGSKGLHGYGSSGKFLVSCISMFSHWQKWTEESSSR